MISFNDIFEDKTKDGTKIKTNEYKGQGKHIIIDQGQNAIAGYTNLDEGLFEDVPAIIFGDHTRIIKFIDTPFFIGADGVKILKAKEKNANYKYLYYALKNVNIPNTGYNRHFKWLKEAKIKYPDQNIQCKIVKVLDTISKVILLKNKQIELLDEIVKARFIEMFGDPVINPMQWDKVKLNTCLRNIENGKSFICDGIPRIEENPAILKLSAVTNGIYNPEENKAIIDKNDFVESAEVHKGDLLFTRKNTPELVGMAAYVSSTPGKLMMPDLIFRLNTNLKCNKVYLWKLINHDLFRKQIQNIASGSAKSMSNISKARLENLSICLPPIKQQNQFADFVQQVDKSKIVSDVRSKFIYFN